MIREAAVAGMFYPAEPTVLKQTVQDMLHCVPEKLPQLKALIVPHAGYQYSGKVAGVAYSHLLDLKDQIHRVVLIGPSHRVAFNGIAASCSDAFSTPLGNILLDIEVIQKLINDDYIICLEEAHELEHSLEVQLPFLWATLDEFELVPLVCGNTSAQAVSELLALFVDDPATLIVISSDLSHFLDYKSAQKMDAATAYAIEHLKPEEIAAEQACGRLPVQGLLQMAREQNLQVKRLDLKNSGDTAGSKDRVVGYGAWAIY